MPTNPTTTRCNVHFSLYLLSLLKQTHSHVNLINKWQTAFYQTMCSCVHKCQNSLTWWSSQEIISSLSNLWIKLKDLNFDQSALQLLSKSLISANNFSCVWGWVSTWVAPVLISVLLGTTSRSSYLLSSYSSMYQGF